MSNNKVIPLPNQARYKTELITYNDGKDQYSYVLIVKKGDLFSIEDTLYSEFFFSKYAINKSIFTKEKTYARHIVPFLNYIFIDSPNRIENISELTPKLASEYVANYSRGYIKMKNEPKAPLTVKDCMRVLTVFLKWLFERKGKPLRHFSKDMFTDNNLFIINLPKEKRKRPRLEDLTSYGVLQLIKVAEEHDPMMAFPITLQAFVGLRAGDVCQISDDRFTWTASTWDFVKDKELLKELEQSSCKPTPINAFIQLEVEAQLRSDNVITSGIKRHRLQPIHEGLIPIIKDMYNRHIVLLREAGINNRYGALLVNKWDKAMTSQNYYTRFEKIVLRLLDRLSVLSQYDVRALELYQLMCKNKLTSHTLRYYYSNLIATHVSNPNLIAYYRGDKSIVAVLVYLARTSTTRAEIKAIQDSLLESYTEIFEGRGGNDEHSKR